ncbi:MAG: hypothetical protein SCJ94_07190 [Bacillota bacterium]|nr:hypothetical protein [Bacillota bacterium]
MAKLLNIGKQDVSMEQALSQFLLFRKSRGIADSTLEEHKYLIKAFIKRCNTCEGVSEELTTFIADPLRKRVLLNRLIIY